MTLLKVENLRKNFGDNVVLKNISLEVNKGEVVSIIGPSGSGKSTLLRCCTTLETVDGGKIKYGDMTLVEDIDGVSTYSSKQEIKKIKSFFGLVFQQFNLFPHYSVMKNLVDPQMTVLGKSKEEAEKTAEALLKKMGLTDKANAYPCQLSGGQQQRVSIARALSMNPQVLFFDEPTSSLDPELTGEVLKVIRGLKSDDSTMIVVTHEMEFAKNVSDKVIFMANGVIEEEGAPQEVFENPKSEILKAFLSKAID